MANASQIISDDMTLEEKLEAIEKAMKNAQEMANEEAASKGNVAAPIDPQDFLMCESCQ
ncbi:MAG: hypothetical protein ACHQTE_00525 [Candidatus Saccharimonadales bacterium]